MLAALPIPKPSQIGGPWARSPSFDLLWLVGLPSLGSVLVLLALPALALLAWPLFSFAFAQPHLVATYVRVYAPRGAWRQQWRTTILLPLGLLAAILSTLAWGGPQGLAVLMTLSFAWAYWHYTRQAFGVARYYQRRLGHADPRDRQLLWLAVHVPALGASLWFLARMPPSIRELPVLQIPIPLEWAGVAVALAPLAVLPALLRAWRGGGAGAAGRLDLLMVLVCVVMFYATLVFTADALAAYVGLALWHSLQYLAFVYHAEEARWTRAPGAGLLPWLLAEGYRWRYLGFVIALAGCLFALPPYLTRVLGGTDTVVAVAALATLLVVNFHHNLLDTWIWRTPAQPGRSAPPSDPDQAAAFERA
jgi:hypothetical protein